MDMTNAVATGTTGETFSIPTTLMPGTYYYFCRVSATGAESVDTCAAMVTVEPQPPELTFMDSDSYDVPAGIVNTAISEINVSGGVSGGTAPYSFSFEPGAPIWLTIDGSTGIITGTRPAAPTDAATAVIRVTDSASVSKTITINVGAVTAPTYSASVSPTSKTFAAATVGFGQQTAQEFTITNTGTGIITGLSAALGGGPASEFEISTALSAASLSSGGTATISVRPKTGLTANTYNDTLTITGSNGISLSVNLSFTVNPATSTDKILISVTTLRDHGVATGTAKTAPRWVCPARNAGDQRW